MPAHRVEVLAIGHSAYDYSVFVDGFPRENSKLEIRTMAEGGGGPAANAAYLLSRWGVDCSFAGLLGDDFYGERIRREFESVGTDLALAETCSEYATPLSIIMVNTRNGSRTIVNRKAGSNALRLNPSQLIGLSPEVLLFDGHELEASLIALESFPDAVSILDAGSLRSGIRELAGKVSDLVASERFALQASGLPDLASENNQQECLRRLQAMARPRASVVVTLGERGLIYDAEGTCRRLPAYPAKAVDTTGAGDVFHGAFAYGMLRKVPLDETLKLASMAAALSVRERGGRQSIPSLDAVRKALDDARSGRVPNS